MCGVRIGHGNYPKGHADTKSVGQEEQCHHKGHLNVAHTEFLQRIAGHCGLGTEEYDLTMGELNNN